MGEAMGKVLALATQAMDLPAIGNDVSREVMNDQVLKQTIDKMYEFHFAYSRAKGDEYAKIDDYDSRIEKILEESAELTEFEIVLEVLLAEMKKRETEEKDKGRLEEGEMKEIEEKEAEAGPTSSKRANPWNVWTADRPTKKRETEQFVLWDECIYLSTGRMPQNWNWVFYVFGFCDLRFLFLVAST